MNPHPRIPERLRVAEHAADEALRRRAAESWRREERPRLLELFRQHIYGRAPVGRPGSPRFDVTEESGG